MRSAVITFPGSNCDRDMALALERATGTPAERVWHKETALPDRIELVAIPGGFSFGDYLRCGAIAARAPIMEAVRGFAAKGGHILGVCNGFQVLTESELLPGALIQNSGLRFLGHPQDLVVATDQSVFTEQYKTGETVTFPIAHHEGNYRATDDQLKALNAEDRIAFRYAGNPNGAADDIAGILSPNRRVLGLMPHPERATDPALGNIDGARLFAGLVGAFMPV